MPLLPFTHEQFVDLFAAYNGAVWPAQVGAYALGLAVACAVLVRVRWAPRLGSLALAAMWAWTGIAYQGLYFARINPAAPAFGALFVAQAAMFAFVAARGGLHLGRGQGTTGLLGWLLVAYALLAYPLLGMALGQSYPRLPMFGITPCPVVIFTFGILLLATERVPWWLLVVPAAWSLVGGSAAALLQMPQDWVLLACGLAVIPIVLAGRRSGSRAAANEAASALHAARR